jgi:glycerophosphoryl diester phosphodiesterase
VAAAGGEAAGASGPWRVPALREALELVVSRGVKVMVDLPGPAAGRAATRVVHDLGCLPDVVFAGNLAALADIRDRTPDAVIAMSWSSPRPPADDLLHHVRPAYLNPRHLWVTRRMIRRMRDRGILMSAWTVDSPRRMARLAAMGVDAIITNDIRALVRTLPAHDTAAPDRPRTTGGNADTDPAAD